MTSETLAEKAVANVLNESKRAGTEPPAVITGNGTTDGLYDAGSLPETTTQPSTEPLSGQNGTSTAEDPYDQDAPEQEQVQDGKIEHSTPTGFPEHQGSEAPQAEVNVEEAQAITASKNLLEEKDKETAEDFKECTGTTTQGGYLDAANTESRRKARRKISDQRDVSPGTRADGSHAKTASARGEVYEVSKLSKFKNKLGFGKS